MTAVTTSLMVSFVLNDVDLTAYICISSNGGKFIKDNVAKRSDSGACTVLKYGLDKRRVGVGLAAGQEIFLFSKTSRLSLGPRQSHVKMVAGVLSFVVEASGE